MNSDWTAVEIDEADLHEQQLDVTLDEDPGLETLAARITAAWDITEGDRLDQLRAVPIDGEERAP